MNEQIQSLKKARWICGAIEHRSCVVGLPYEAERRIYQRARALLKSGSSPAIAIAWAMRKIDDAAICR
jgi:hypothetical protein